MRNWLLRWWRLSSTFRIYVREVLKARKGVWIGLVCAFGGMLTLPLGGRWALVVALVLLVLGVVQLLWEVLALRRSQEEHLLRPRPLDHLLHGGLTPALTSRGYVLERDGRHSILRNPGVDLALAREVAVVAHQDPGRWTTLCNDADADLRLMVLAEALGHRQVIFDGDKVRLMNDLVLTKDGGIADITLQPVRYTSTLWTNDLANRQLVRDGGVVFDGIDAFTQEGLICSLESSNSANAIGVSTLAFDPLGAIYFVQQGHRNVQSPGLLSPSGSGSADWTDLDAGPSPLSPFVVRVAEREMREELGIGPDVETESRVVGFGRWVSRGAKPEFFCLTRLSRPVPRGRLTPEERIFTHRGGTEVFPLPLEARAAADAIAVLLAERKETLAVPLFWCLTIMRERLLSDDDKALVYSVFERSGKSSS